jgi:protein O-mannosyl-transferase
MRGLGSPLRDKRSAVLVVSLVAASIYANSLWNLFAYDDMYIVVNNPAVRSLRGLPAALRDPYWPGALGVEQGLWRPATTVYLAVVFAIGGGSAWVFHLFNVIAHATASALVVLLAAAMMPLPASLVAGLVFAVHPVHVEAVSNIIGIAEILSAVAALAACLIHVRGPDRSGWRQALLVGGLYLVSFGAKESGVTLPGLIFLLDAARQRISFRDLGAYLRQRWRVYVVMVVVAGALLAGRHAVLGSIASPFGPLGADLLEEIPRIWTIGEVWTHYVRLWVFPLDLSADYSPNVIPIATGWNAENIVGVGVVLTVLAMTLLAWRRPLMKSDSSTARAAAFGVVWFMIAISPVSNVLFLAGVLLAERNLYLPSAGLAIATGWLVMRMARERPRLVPAAVGSLLLLGVVRTWTRTPVWKDNTTIFSSLLRDYPHSGRSQWIIGDQYLEGGNISQGLLAYRAAISLLGGHYMLVTEIGYKLMLLERYDASEKILGFAWRDDSRFAIAASLIASIRSERGDAAGTELWARRSLAINPHDDVRRHLLAWALAAQGRFAEARKERASAEALGRVRFWQQWAYWAYVRREEGDTVGALVALDSAWASVATGMGRASLDSIRVADFGLQPLDTVPEAPKTP